MGAAARLTPRTPWTSITAPGLLPEKTEVLTKETSAPLSSIHRSPVLKLAVDDLTLPFCVLRTSTKVHTQTLTPDVLHPTEKIMEQI